MADGEHALGHSTIFSAAPIPLHENLENEGYYGIGGGDLEWELGL